MPPLGAAGVVVAGAGRGVVSLAAAMALVGVTSGAADVAINTLAGRAERAAGRPVITRVHGVFSTFVVLASLGTGLLAGAGAPPVIGFAGAGLVAVAAAAAVQRSVMRGPSGPATGSDPGFGQAGGQGRERAVPTATLVGLGLLGALAYASENAHQSWSAIFLTDAIGAGEGVGALAPAVFAAAVAATRFAAGGIGTAHARAVLATGSAAAAGGALLVAGAPSLVLGLLGLVVAAAGTAVLFPTVLAVVAARTDERHRGRATSVVTTVAYLGFVLGPVYVGVWSGALGIRGAMVAVAVLGALLLVLTPLVRGERPRVSGCGSVRSAGRGSSG
ncbi:MFS transporter [Nocardioides sp. TF02-7]|uniref:MFS transporter n=1 Tax=Nocardioides sp. TF02-7 TaxID=2917724 RepID=UPI001F05C71D|nr:MFS transporter [Nocardioides sp. TF02-7]UMG93335.1 MFS transporter [Nocardioides sp. TF02-7]